MKTRRSPRDMVGYVALRLVVLLLVLYIVIPVVRQVRSQYETETVTYITVTESGTTSGTIVRSEQLLTSDRPYISFLLDDGEKVAAGGTVAVAVRAQDGLDIAQRTYEVETEISYLRDLLSRVANTADDSEQETAIRGAVYRLSAAAGQTDAAALDSAGATLTSLLRGGSAVSQTELDSLQTELDMLRGSLSSDDFLSAPAAGVFTTEVDGWEGLAPSALSGISPEGVDALRGQNANVAENVVGKIVTDAAWYYAAVMAEEDSDRLRVGDETSLDFGYRSSSTVHATVRSISPTNSDGRVAVVFRCTSALAETLNLRNADAEVVFHTYSGLRVPRKAVHVQDGQTVVYTASAGQMEEKAVEILYTGEDFYLIALGNEGSSLRAGNEVIVSGKDLQDGKIMN